MRDNLEALWSGFVWWQGRPVFHPQLAQHCHARLDDEPLDLLPDAVDVVAEARQLLEDARDGALRAVVVGLRVQIRFTVFVERIVC